MTAVPPDGPSGSDSRPTWPDGQPILPVVVPDDLSELEAEITALRRERAALARRARWGRLGRWIPGPAGAGAGPSARHPAASRAILAATLLFVAAFGGMLAALSPRVSGPTAPNVPLATPSVAAGRIGGLVPAVQLRTHGRPLPSRALPRPALLVLVPPGCPCATAASLVLEQAAEIPIEVVFISATADESLADSYAADAPDLSFPAADPRGQLAAAYLAPNAMLTLVFVRTDGVVTSIRHGFRAGDRLETSLDVVQAQPVAPPAGAGVPVQQPGPGSPSASRSTATRRG